MRTRDIPAGCAGGSESLASTGDFEEALIALLGKDAGGAYGSTPASWKGTPTPKEISEMEYILDWLAWLRRIGERLTNTAASNNMDDFEILDPRFRAYVLPNAPLVQLGEGFAWLKGPVWFADQDCLLVSDLPNDRIMRWTPDGGMSVFRSPSGFANGHTRDRQGRLIGCSHQHRCPTRTELDGRMTVLADNYEGKRLRQRRRIA